MTPSRPRKSRQRDQRAERHADQRGQHHRRQADDQRQPHDREQRGIAAEDELKGGGVGWHWKFRLANILRRRYLHGQFSEHAAALCILMHMPELLTTDEAADLSAAVRAQALRAGGRRRRALQQGHRPLAVSESRARPLGRRRPDRARRRWRRCRRRRSSAAATIRCWNGRCARAARGLASLPEGSEAGLRRLARGEVMAAAIHLHRLDGDDETANVEAVATRPACTTRW